MSGPSNKSAPSGINHLQQEVDRLKLALEEEKQKSQKFKADLRERNKELKCHMEMSELFGKTHLSHEEHFQGLTNIVSKAFRYPEHTSCSLTIGDSLYLSSGFKKSVRRFQQKVVLRGGLLAGQITVYLAPGAVKKGEKSFLGEEKDFLISIARRLAFFVDEFGREDALSESNALYKSVMDTSPDVITITDLEGKVLLTSKRTGEIFGTDDPEFFLGKSILDFIHPDQRSKAKKGIRDMFDANALGTEEYKACKADGAEFYMEVNGEVIPDANGRPSKLLFVSRDITERRIAQQKIRELNLNLEKKVEERTRELERFFAVSTDFLCITNLRGEFIKTNNAWNTLLGLDEIKLKGRSVMDFIHLDDQKKSRKVFKGNATGKGTQDFTVRMIHNDGGYKDVEWHAAQVDNRIYAAARDITERVKLEQSLQSSIYKEKEINEIKSRFVSMASHEFRTPLASIMLSCESLLTYWSRMDHEQIKEKLSNVLHQTDHLSSIVKDVMQLSKIQEGKHTFKPGEYDFLKLCKDTIRDFNTDASLKTKIAFRPEFKTLTLKIDKRLILQVLYNLLSNAIKYAQPDPIIQVDLKGKGKNILLTVKDNGMGIPLEDQRFLFQPFYRATNARSLKGNGLGLNIVRESIRIQGGDIYFESEQGKGSTFYVLIPNVLIIEKSENPCL